MVYKYFKVNGANILVLQRENGMVEFYMNCNTSNFSFCEGFNANIDDITEDDALRIWRDNIDEVIEDENVLINHADKSLERTRI